MEFFRNAYKCRKQEHRTRPWDPDADKGTIHFLDSRNSNILHLNCVIGIVKYRANQTLHAPFAYPVLTLSYLPMLDLIRVYLGPSHSIFGGRTSSSVPGHRNSQDRDTVDPSLAFIVVFVTLSNVSLSQTVNEQCAALAGGAGFVAWHATR